MNFYRRAKRKMRKSVTALRADDRPLHIKAWSLASILVGIGVVAAICWFAAAILLFVFPAKWTFIVGLVKIIRFLGKWVTIIAGCGAFICYVAGPLIALFRGKNGNIFAKERRDKNGYLIIDRK